MKVVYVGQPIEKEAISVSPALALGLGLAIIGVFVLGIYPQPFIKITQIAAQSILLK